MNTRIATQVRHLLLQPLVALVLGAGLVWPMAALAEIKATLIVDGYLIAEFNEFRGIVNEIEIEDDVSVKDPSQKSVAYITAKRPAIDLSQNPDDTLWEWLELVRTGALVEVRRSFAVTLFDKKVVVKKFWCENGYPNKGSLYPGTGKQTLVEEWGFACERIQAIAP